MDWTGEGVERLGVTPHVMLELVGEGYFFSMLRPNSSASGTCTGDSGGAANNTTLLDGGVNVSLGIASKSGSSPCTRVGLGYRMLYSVPDGTWIKSLVDFFGGSCRMLTHSAYGTSYLRCW
jgi:hypothetical protein